MDSFRKEAEKLSTRDLLLILEDQQELYSEEEIAILIDELASRPENALEIESKEEEIKARIEEERLVQAERKLKEEKRRQIFENKINNLRLKGYSGYYEYTTLSLLDNNGGVLAVEQVSELLNTYSLEGWRLVSAYANELGRNSTSGGFGGISTGINSTVEQHILIMERFVKI